MKTAEVAVWIVHNRRGAAFKDYKFDDIIRELITFKSAVVFNAAGGIQGCATGEVVGNNLKIRNVLASSPGGLKKLVKLLKNSNLGELTIIGNRKGKETAYDPRRLYKHFSL